MEKQSKKLSLVESITNTLLGLLTSYLVQMLVFPLLGINITHQTNAIITVIFFVISFTRSYIIRRFFNSIREARRS
jgi:hypothetical protein